MKKIFNALIVLMLAMILSACSGPQSTVYTAGIFNTQTDTADTAQATASAMNVITPPVTSLPTEPTASVVDTASPGQTVSANPFNTPDTSVQTPSNTPSVSITVPLNNKALIESFETGSHSQLITSFDWSSTPSFGVTNPVLSTTSSDTDSGRGYMVKLPAGASCQSLTISGKKVADAFEAGGYCLRFWISNKTDGSISIGVIAYTDSGNSCFSVANARLYGANGKRVTASYNDASGMGKGVNSAIVVPSGFAGWVTYRTDELISNWGGAVLKNTKGVNKLVIDARPSGFEQNQYYVLDELMLTDDLYGEVRPWTDPAQSTQNKSQQISSAMNQAVKTTPKISDYEPLIGYTVNDDNNIKAITFDGMDRNGKKTKVFAWVGYPENASSQNKVPAVVLLHGGGGVAYYEWVEKWNDAGYAAIAMCNTGYFPVERNGQFYWEFGLPKGLAGAGYTNPPDNDAMGSSGGRVENMWMYHAVGQSILAANILRADSRVDSSKVGITGISWGGVITALTIGFDNRFAFAVPVYGSGYLNEALTYMGYCFSETSTNKLWLAQDRFDKVKMPVLWLGWNDDNCFSINSNSKSYLATIKNNPNTRLSMKNEMMHSHVDGWAPNEIIFFADSVVNGGQKLTGFKNQPSGRNINVRLTIEQDAIITNTTLYYITSKMTYSNHSKYGFTSSFMDQVWQKSELSVNFTNGAYTVTGTVPAYAKGYYIEVTTLSEHSSHTFMHTITTSAYIEL